jgi:hypothetical protein
MWILGGLKGRTAITGAAMNAAGKVVTESILETKAATILQFIRGLGGWAIRPAQASGQPGYGVPSGEERFAEIGQQG